MGDLIGLHKVKNPRDPSQQLGPEWKDRLNHQQTQTQSWSPLLYSWGVGHVNFSAHQHPVIVLGPPWSLVMGFA